MVNERQAKVIKALESEKFDWRTIDGLIKDTGLRSTEIQEVLNDLPDIVVRTTGKRGELLYTTREHYSLRAGIGRKLFTALTGDFK